MTWTCSTSNPTTALVVAACIAIEASGYEAVSEAEQYETIDSEVCRIDQLKRRASGVEGSPSSRGRVDSIPRIRGTWVCRVVYMHPTPHM